MTPAPEETGTPAPIDQTAEEVFESLTGFEEIAIAKHFDGQEITDLAENRPMAYMRALVFVTCTRQGLSAPDAKSAALSLTIKGVTEHFAEDPEDPIEDEPDSDVGKDGNGRHAAPVPSGPGAS